MFHSFHFSIERIFFRTSSFRRPTANKNAPFVPSAGLTVTVESAYNITYVEERIRNFIHNVAPWYLKKLSKKMFEDHKDALVHSKLQKPTGPVSFGSRYAHNHEDHTRGSRSFFSLTFLVSDYRYWVECYRACKFRRAEDEAEIARNLTQKDLIDYMQRNILDARHARVLVVAIEATEEVQNYHKRITAQQSDGYTMTYNSIRAFQSSLRKTKPYFGDDCTKYSQGSN